MTAAAAGIEYASARLAARFGARPTEFDWRRIEVLRDYAALLDTGRTMPPFSPWLVGLTAADDPHGVEHALRERWRERVGEVARWMPEAWQPPVHWCAGVVDLPLLVHRAVGGTPPSWSPADPSDARLDRAPRPRAPSGRRDAQPGAQHRAAAQPLDAWLAEWRRRLPIRDGHSLERTPLTALITALREHLPAFLEPSRRDGWPVRRALVRRLESLFQRSLLDPAAAFVYLALTALDSERLRGELLRRLAFPHLAVSR